MTPTDPTGVPRTDSTARAPCRVSQNNSERMPEKPSAPSDSRKENMEQKNQQTHIAYRCPECGTLTVGFVGKYALVADLLRLRCTCKGSGADIRIDRGGKVHLSVPCVLCKQNHTYTVSQNIFFGRDSFVLSCPYANMGICFIGTEENIEAESKTSGQQLQDLMRGVGADTLGDIQPQDLDEADILPEAEVYDTARFTVRVLEDEGKIDCPCHRGQGYDLRYYDKGVQVYCPTCGATYDIPGMTAASVAALPEIDEMRLH